MIVCTKFARDNKMQPFFFPFLECFLFFPIFFCLFLRVLEEALKRFLKLKQVLFFLLTFRD